jgi:peptidoglycan/xylan/chitin deacetylase (PgdA/CDA1 family)
MAAWSRRSFLSHGAATVAGISGLARARSIFAAHETQARRNELAADPDRALVAITLDLEMSRNFPTWETTHWDFEKGNLNEESKQYTVEACRRVKQAGGVLHTFAVGRVLEQEDVSWLRGIAEAGHPIGNHTYDHVRVTATKPEDVQFRFQRAPWLIAGQTPAEAIAENIRLATLAMKQRIGVSPMGFRTPGGFAEGLVDRPDLQQMVQSLGFDWVSSKYPRHANSMPGVAPDESVFADIVQSQAAAQPFVYPNGLVEVPMSPISDVGAFRNGRWQLDDFLKAIRLSVQWAIEQRAVYDFLSHPSCLYVTDPQFKAIDLICEMVDQAGDRAAIVDLGVIAQRARLRAGKIQ